MMDERSRMERYIKTVIQGMNMGPHRAILSVLQFHIGRDQAISRKALLEPGDWLGPGRSEPEDLYQ